MEVLKGPKAKRFRFECRECGGVWERWFVSAKDARRYVRGRDVCWAGKHVVEGGLKRVVKVRKG